MLAVGLGPHSDSSEQVRLAHRPAKPILSASVHADKRLLLRDLRCCLTPAVGIPASARGAGGTLLRVARAYREGQNRKRWLHCVEQGLWRRRMTAQQVLQLCHPCEH
eukprot:scaffold189307_cov31-Tisochrysis_lutea.AAC.1